MSNLGSAAIINDFVVYIFAGVVVEPCAQKKLQTLYSFLVSLSSTSNIRSALTTTGNFQNILIVSHMYNVISWANFSSNIVLPVIAAIFFNWIMLCL